MKYQLYSIAVLTVLSGATVTAADAVLKEMASYNVGTKPYAVTCVDLDNDGDQDIAVANYNSSYMNFLYNDGNGNFDSVMTFDIGDPGAMTMVAAELNGDEYTDLVVGNSPHSKFKIIYNYGEGTFLNEITIGSETTVIGLKAADLDGDEDNDLVVTRATRGTVMTNNDGVSFDSLTAIGYGYNALGVCLADFDNDGDTDLAAANKLGDPIPGRVTTWFNNGDGTFKIKGIEYHGGFSPMDLCSADLDGNGFADIAAANNESNDVSVMFNNGDSTFTDMVFYPAENGPRSIHSFDIDDDNDYDLIVTSKHSGGGGGLTVLSNDGNGVFTETWRISMDNGLSGSFPADLDGDGDIDLAATGYYDDVVTTFFNYPYLCGDADGDREITVGDAVFLIGFVFKGGPAPNEYDSGNANCYGGIDVADIVFLINHVFKDGPAPCCP